jgi:hypothetical protein
MNAKTYETPTMKVVKLQQRRHILAGSEFHGQAGMQDYSWQDENEGSGMQNYFWNNEEEE